MARALCLPPCHNEAPYIAAVCSSIHGRTPYNFWKFGLLKLYSSPSQTRTKLHNMTTLRAVLLGFLLVATITIARSVFGLLRHVRRAQRSGIPYTVVPISSYNLLFVLFGPRVLNLLDRVLGLPSSETSWRWLVRGSWPWRRRYAPFAHMGSDTFLTVTPSGSILYTADADVISQILGRMADFPKPTFLYKNVDIFGKNVMKTERAAWRRFCL